MSKEKDLLAPVLAIVGSREFENLEIVRFTANWFAKRGIGICSGGAKGVDKAAEEAARLVHPSFVESYPVKVEPGKRLSKFEFRELAFARNKQIANRSTGVLGFWAKDSGGTANTITYAVSIYKPTFVWTRNEKPGENFLKMVELALWETYM